MKQTYYLRNQKGFTLIELLSVMIIMGVMGSVAVKKVDLITDTASAKALAVAVKELNGTLHCGSQSVVLNRTHSTNSVAGKWQ